MRVWHFDTKMTAKGIALNKRIFYTEISSKFGPVRGILQNCIKIILELSILEILRSVLNASRDWLQLNLQCEITAENCI
jgi:hypothetical protein